MDQEEVYDFLIKVKAMRIFPMHSRNTNYLPVKNYCLGKYYIKETSAGSNQYVLDSAGEDYLDLCFNAPSLPQSDANTKHIIRYHISAWIVKIFQNDWIKLIMTGIIAL
jgi:hypothetical protein